MELLLSKSQRWSHKLLQLTKLLTANLAATGSQQERTTAPSAISVSQKWTTTAPGSETASDTTTSKHSFCSAFTKHSSAKSMDGACSHLRSWVQTTLQNYLSLALYASTWPTSSLCWYQLLWFHSLWGFSCNSTTISLPSKWWKIRPQDTLVSVQSSNEPLMEDLRSIQTSTICCG